MALDLFSGAQGTAVGLARAGYEVHCVDNTTHAKHPEVASFITADAMEVLDQTAFCRRFQLIVAGPPCQGYSDMSDCRPGLAATYPDLVGPVRTRLQAIGVPWVMENVGGSGLAEQSGIFGEHGVILCGHMFGLKLYRHRLFETSAPVHAPHHPRHLTPASKAGHWRPGTIMSVAGHVSPIGVARAAMGIDWMTREQLAEAIPPAYSQHVGQQMMPLALGAPAEAFAS